MTKKQQTIEKQELEISRLKDEAVSSAETFRLKEEEKNAEILELKNTLDLAEKELDSRQLQLDRNETKKLAKAYEDQENTYNKSASKWLKYLSLVAVALVISALVSIVLPSGKGWYDELKYYFIDIVLVSAAWFTGSQYSDYIKLRNDYSNRKTLAQSFNNILNNLPEDELIKSKFIEKATDVLCAPSVVTNKEPVLSKKLVKDTAELIKSIRS